MCTRSTPCRDPLCSTNVAWEHLACLVWAVVARGGLLSQADADDASQDAMLIVLSRAQPGETPEDLRSFAEGVAGWTRWGARRRLVRERLWKEHFAKSVVAETGTDDFTEEVETRLDVQEALSRIPNDVREVVVTVYCGGLTLDAAVAKLGRTKHCIRQHLAKAASLLKRSLEEWK